LVTYSEPAAVPEDVPEELPKDVGVAVGENVGILLPASTAVSFAPTSTGTALLPPTARVIWLTRIR
jgi:hypothetical protein